MLRETDREPGLVAFYHNQPGNGVGLFLQPRSPSDVIKTFFKIKTKTKILSRPRLSLVFKTKTKTLHLKTKTFFC